MRARRQADQALVASDGAASVSTKGFDPSRVVRRTLSTWGTAPRDGTPFHTLSTLRFNPFRGCFEGLCRAEGGGHEWHPVKFGEQLPTWWLRRVPLPYELPSSFAFTMTYEARCKPRWQLFLERLLGSHAITAATAYRWRASVIAKTGDAQ